MPAQLTLQPQLPERGGRSGSPLAQWGKRRQQIHSHLAAGPGPLLGRLLNRGLVLPHCTLASVVFTFHYSPTSRGLCAALCPEAGGGGDAEPYRDGRTCPESLSVVGRGCVLVGHSGPWDRTHLSS